MYVVHVHLQRHKRNDPPYAPAGTYSVKRTQLRTLVDYVVLTLPIAFSQGSQEVA